MRSKMQFRFAATLPTTVCDLDPSERLLLACYRQWVSGLAKQDETALEAAWRGMICRLGVEDARHALSALSELVFRLAGHAARTIHHHQACCRMIGLDEWYLLRLVSACQEETGDCAREAALRFVGREGTGPVAEAAMRLAAALRRGGYPLPDRSPMAERIERALAGMAAEPAPGLPLH